MDPIPTFFTAATLLLALTPSAVAGARNRNEVSGPITIAANRQAGNVTTVEGSVVIGDRAQVEKASSVSGSVILGDQARARSLRSISGGITLGVQSRVAGDVASLSGRIFLGRGAEVAGRVSNVIGPIILQAAHVAGGITTITGDIEVGADSRIEGGIVMAGQNGIAEGDRQGDVATGNAGARVDVIDVGGTPAKSVLLTGDNHGGAILAVPQVGPATAAQGTESHQGQVMIVQRHCADAVANGSGGKSPPAAAGRPVRQIEVAPGVRSKAQPPAIDDPICEAGGPPVCAETDGRCVLSPASQRSVPSIVIGPRAVVQGTLDFRREVTLKVSDSATIGPVKGATVERYSGTSP